MRRLLSMILAAFALSVSIVSPAAADDGFTGTYRLWAEGSGGCMVPEGSKIVSWAGCGNAHYADQDWLSWPNGDGSYELRNGARDQCLAVPNSSINARAIIEPCNGGPRQRWEENTNEHRPDWADRMLKNRHSGLCLVSQATSANSDPVFQWHCVPQYRDQWWYFH